MKYILGLLWTPMLLAQPQWQYFESGSKASLRGLAAVSAQCCWASGSEGTVLLTHDGGQSWQDVSPAGYDSLQFRDIQAFNDSTAIILSAGLPAVILKTTNGGQSWQETYCNEEQGVFFDALDFWNPRQGIAFSDAPVNKLLVITTRDSGQSWQPLPMDNLPAVDSGQGGFAASGTCLKTFGKSKVIIGLGGPEATVLLSEDYGKSWLKTRAPIDQGAAAKGIFSFAFQDSLRGFCVGGDYRADSLSHHTIARTRDGGRSWQALPHSAVAGKYRSSISYAAPNTLVAVSRTGCHYSFNDGEHWRPCEGAFYSLSATPQALWASGAQGAIARWLLQ